MVWQVVATAATAQLVKVVQTSHEVPMEFDPVRFIWLHGLQDGNKRAFDARIIKYMWLSVLAIGVIELTLTYGTNVFIVTMRIVFVIVALNFEILSTNSRLSSSTTHNLDEMNFLYLYFMVSNVMTLISLTISNGISIGIKPFEKLHQNYFCWYW